MKLANDYRPQKFEDMVGHELNIKALEGMVRSKDLPNGLLFAGHTGSGKTTLARIIARELDADVIEVDAASHGGVAEIRKLTDNLKYMTSKEYTVLILDEAQSLTRDAFNAILKTLEEPPSGVLFIFTTTDPQKIPMTVRTRLIEFRFNPLAPIDILRRLVDVTKAEGINVSSELLKYIALTSEGSARKALTDLGMASGAEIREVEEFKKLSGKRIDYTILVKKIADNDFVGLFKALDDAMTKTPIPSHVVDEMVIILKDLMIIRGKGDDPTVSVAAREMKKDIARVLTPERIFAMLRILWDLKTQVKSRGDNRQDVELAMVLMFEVANRGRD